MKAHKRVTIRLVQRFKSFSICGWTTPTALKHSWYQPYDHERYKLSFSPSLRTLNTSMRLHGVDWTFSTAWVFSLSPPCICIFFLLSFHFSWVSLNALASCPSFSFPQFCFASFPFRPLIFPFLRLSIYFHFCSQSFPSSSPYSFFTLLPNALF